MTKYEYFTDDEIKETLLDNLDGYEGIADYTFEEVLNDLFNTGEYFIGYQVAANALKKYRILIAKLGGTGTLMLQILKH